MWTANLQDSYANRQEWTRYSMMYGLAKRLGFRSAKKAWEANPLIQGSTNPADFRVVPQIHELNTRRPGHGVMDQTCPDIVRKFT